MYCFYAWFKKGGFESIKLFSYNSLCRCCKAHTILKSIRICLCFEGCGGDAFPHIAKKSPSSGCFFKRDFGESSLLKLRNFKTSIRICLCFEGCGGDSFHQIAKNQRQAGASSSWSSENGPSWCREGSEKIKESLMFFIKTIQTARKKL